MGRILLLTAVVLLGVGGWYASAHYSLEIHRTATGAFQYVRIVPRAAKVETSTGDPTDQPPAAPLRPTIRVASFNVDGLDDSRLANPKVCESLLRIVARFDVVAMQNIHSANCGALMRLKDLLNATGRSYDFITCPTLDKDSDTIYNAMLYDATTVEVDHSTVHSINTPVGMLRARPLVAEFRVRGPPANEAFTFALINVLVDPPGGPQDLNLLADVFVAERDRGLGADRGKIRGEDDIIMVGDLEADPEHFGRLGNMPNMTAAINGLPSTTRGTRLADNILFDRRATVEYNSRSGVLDIVRELDLTPQEALEVSSHLPVWAEFSSYENGQASHAN
jgi:deoxyribonuclease-1-like protein